MNVVRNVNYLTLCIKNEMQRHTNSIARSKVVIFGLSLLDAVFCDTDVTEPVMDAIRGLCQRPGTGLLQLPVATQSRRFCTHTLGGNPPHCAVLSLETTPKDMAVPLSAA